MTKTSPPAPRQPGRNADAVPTPTDHRKAFIKAFERIAQHHDRHRVLSDFLDLATCAIRKTTLPPGEAADAIEARYMATVGRNKPEDIRAMPDLLGITALAVGEGGCDFLGQVVGELELLNQHMGQFFTPYTLSRMMAEMTLQDVDGIIAEKGFVTVAEPACGAGGMILAIADVLASKGHDIGQTLYVEAIDLSDLCFKMSYLQLSLRGIPATVRRGNSLSLEMFESAITPAYLPFASQHREGFKAWREEAIRPIPPSEARPAPTPPTAQLGATARQLSLFDIG